MARQSGHITGKAAGQASLLNAGAAERSHLRTEAFDQVLFYGTGGLALADTTVSASALGVTFSDSKTLTGWTVGAGAEWMFMPHWSLKAEYLYRSFGGQTFFAAQFPPGIATGTLNVNSGQVGVNFHF